MKEPNYGEMVWEYMELVFRLVTRIHFIIVKTEPVVSKNTFSDTALSYYGVLVRNSPPQLLFLLPASRVTGIFSYNLLLDSCSSEPHSPH